MENMTCFLCDKALPTAEAIQYSFKYAGKLFSFLVHKRKCEHGLRLHWRKRSEMVALWYFMRKGDLECLESA